MNVTRIEFDSGSFVVTTETEPCWLMQLFERPPRVRVFRSRNIFTQRLKYYPNTWAWVELPSMIIINGEIGSQLDAWVNEWRLDPNCYGTPKA